MISIIGIAGILACYAIAFYATRKDGFDGKAKWNLIAVGGSLLWVMLVISFTR